MQVSCPTSTYVTTEVDRSRNLPTPERNTLGLPSSLVLGRFWLFSSSSSAFLFSASRRLSSSSWNKKVESYSYSKFLERSIFQYYMLTINFFGFFLKGLNT